MNNQMNYVKTNSANGKKMLPIIFMLLAFLALSNVKVVSGNVTTCVSGVASFAITSGSPTNCSGGTGPTLTTTISTVSGGTGTAGQTYRVRIFKNTIGGTDTTTSTNVSAGNSGILNSKTVTTYDYIPTINTGGVFYYFAVVYTISNPSGCSAPLTAFVSSAVEVDVFTISNAGLDRTVCKTLQDTIKLAANLPTSGTGAWTIASGPNTNINQIGNVNSRTAAFTPSTPGVYVLTWTIAGNPAGCQTSNVTVTQNTDANAGSNQSVCSTAPSVTLAANTPVVGAGTWSVVVGSPNTSTTQFSDVNSPIATFTPASGAGNYVLTWTLDNNSPCTTTANVTITVVDPPSIANAGPDQTICFGTPTSMAATIPTNGAGFWTITSGPNTSTSQFASPTSIIPATSDPAATFSPTVSGNYNIRWRITDPPCSYSQNFMSITVLDPPTPADAGANQTICSGTSATLAANTSTIGSGQWSIVAGSPSTLNNQFVSRTNSGTTFTPNSTGVYTLKWTTSNAPCSTSTSTMTLTVTPVVTAGSDQTICSNSTATLAASTPIVGAGVWSVDVSSPNTSTSQFSSTTDPAAVFTPISAGTYVLIWTNTNYPNNCQSANVSITVNDPPTTADAGPNQSMCATTTSITLGANSPSIGTGTWSFQSTPPSTNLGQFSDIHNPFAIFSPDLPGSYTLRWKITNAGCTSSQNSEVLVDKIPPTVSNAGSTQFICSPSISAVLSANAPISGSGVWTVVAGSPNTSTAQFSSTTDPNATFTPTLQGVYTLRWTISNNPCTPSTSDVTIYSNTQIWTGATSTDWNDATNWGGCGSIPAANDYVIINTTANQPVINADAYCYSIDLNNNTSLINNANLSVNKNWNNFGTSFSGTGTVIFTGNGTIDGGFATTFNNLTINSNVTTVLGHEEFVAGILDNAGKITTTNPLTISGTYIHNQDGGTIPTATWSNGSNCNVTGTTSNAPNGIKTQTFNNFSWNCPNQSTFVNLALTTTSTNFNGNFEIVNTNGNYISLASALLPVLYISGDLIIDNGGQLEFCGGNTASPTVYLNGNVIIHNGGALKFSSSATTPTFYVAGNWTLYSGGTFLGNSNGVSTVNFNGTSAQIIGGTGVTTFNNLVLNNAAGISLANNETVTGSLTFTSGNVNTNSNVLTLDNAASVSGGGTGWVIGNLRRGIPATLNLATTFDIGNSTNYLPVTLNFNGTPNSTGTITVNQTSGQHTQINTSGLNPAKDVARYWTITNDGNSVTSFTNYGVSFTFLANDVIGSAYTNNFHVALYTGSSWVNTSDGTMTTTTSQGTGVTSFGDFTIGEGCVVPANPTITNNTNTNVLTCSTTAISLTASGGNTYAWSGGSSASAANNSVSTPNSYAVTITNPGGCSASTSISITQDITPPVASSVQSAAITCNGGTTNVTVSASGGTGPYTGTGTMTSVNAGAHTYTVTGANGCTNTTSLTVSQPTNVAYTATMANPVPCSSTTGRITVLASGGSGFYNYSKDGGATWGTSTLFTGLSARTYTVQVRDTKSCLSVAAAKKVGCLTREMEDEAQNVASTFNIYPNPAADHVTVTFHALDEANYSVSMVDVTGRTIMNEVRTSVMGDNQVEINTASIAKGVYFVIFTKGDQKVQSKLIVQ